MIFTEKINEKITKRYEKTREVLDYIYPDYDAKINKKDEGTQSFLKFYYAYMPVQDLLDYPFYYFEKYAEDSLELYEEMRRKVLKGELEDGLTDEKRDAMFLNYVAFHRSNNEDFYHSRMFKFEGLDKRRFEGLSDYDKVKEINYWASEHVTYHASDDRTMSAVMTWMNGYGRCGEESVFLIEVLRSNGIMARQVYSPFWAHCDDNHAWVEVFVDGDWHYLGACEPEPVLDKAWFTDAAKRALVTRTIVFTDLLDEDDEVIGEHGNASYINLIKRYARTNEIEITVLNEFGERVPDCEVHIQVINYASYRDVAVKRTDREGKIRINIGLGTVNIRLRKENIYANYLINTEENTHELILKENEAKDFVDKDILAPTDDYDWHTKQSLSYSNEKEKKAKSARIREDKISRKIAFAVQKYETYLARMKNDPEAMAAINAFDVRGFFEKSYANIISLITFLSMDGDAYDLDLKFALLNTLLKKDFGDFEFDYLYTHLKHVKAFRDSVPEEAFIKGILPIRIDEEYLGDYVGVINDNIPDSLQEKFRANPVKIATYVDWLLVNTNKDVVFDPALYTWAKSAIKHQMISEKDRNFLVVAIARTAGVPAFLRSYDKEVMLYIDGAFRSLASEKEDEIRLSFADENISVNDFSIAKIEAGGDKVLNLNDFDLTGALSLRRGKYRLVTSARLASGNILARERVFDTADTKELRIEKRAIDTKKMLVDYKVDAFSMYDLEGEKHLSTEILSEGLSLAIWLKSGSEPSIHIINELKERNALSENLILIADSLEAAKDLEELGARVYYTTDTEEVFALERKTYVNPETYPLLLLLNKEHRVRFAHSGYSVGIVDLVFDLKNK